MPIIRRRFLTLAGRCHSKSHAFFRIFLKLFSTLFSEYYTLQKCFQEGGRVKAKCTAKDMETVEELMESTSSNALQFFCGEYAEDSDKCEKLGPISTPASGKQAKPKFLRSISLTVAEIFESFPEQKNI